VRKSSSVLEMKSALSSKLYSIQDRFEQGQLMNTSVLEQEQSAEVKNLQAELKVLKDRLRIEQQLRQHVGESDGEKLEQA